MGREKNQLKSYISGDKNLTTPKAGESMEQWELKPFIELMGVSTTALENNLAASNKIKDKIPYDQQFHF